MANVAELVVQMHANIDSIHACVRTLSDTSEHDAEISRLENSRSEKLAALQAQHAASLLSLSRKRETEQAELEKLRKKEEQEIAERRKREDEERKARIAKEEQERERVRGEEDEEREREKEDSERGVSEGVERELERLEDEIERVIGEGRSRLRELDERRKVSLLTIFFFSLFGGEGGRESGEERMWLICGGGRKLIERLRRPCGERA